MEKLHQTATTEWCVLHASRVCSEPSELGPRRVSREFIVPLLHPLQAQESSLRLFASASSGKVVQVPMLLQQGADRHARLVRSVTRRALANRQGPLQRASPGAKVQRGMPAFTQGGETPLMVASKHGHHRFVQTLIDLTPENRMQLLNAAAEVRGGGRGHPVPEVSPCAGTQVAARRSDERRTGPHP